MKKDVLAQLENGAKDFWQVQERTLLKILRDNQNTEYGKKYGFAQLDSGEAFRNHVPVTDYEDYAEYIRRMIQSGETDLITAYPVRYYMVSSGTTGIQKHIPMTEIGIDDYGRYSYECAQEMLMEYYQGRGMPLEEKELSGKIFLINEIRSHQLENGMSTLLVSSAVFKRQQEQGCFDYDCYTSPAPVLFPECSMDMNYLKLRFALACEDVTALEAVYVHQLVNVLHYMKKHWELLAGDIEKGTIDPSVDVPEKIRKQLKKYLSADKKRAQHLRAEFEKGFDTPIVPRIWPKMRFIMAIGGEVFAAYMKRLRGYIGEIPYHYFIYAASEGFFGTALRVGEPDTYVLVPEIGFFEFLPVEQEDLDHTCDFTEVKKGGRYELVYTGTAGFYRYRMGDVIQIAGFYHEAPVVKFCYRRVQCVNLAGEKMDMESISRAVAEFAELFQTEINEFCIYPNVEEIPAKYDVLLELAPGGSPPSMQKGAKDRQLPDTGKKAAEAGPPDMGKKADEEMDRLFRKNHLDYDDCRGLGELDQLKVWFLKPGACERYRQFLQSKGAETGQYKPVRVIDTQEKKEFFFGEVTG